MSGKPADPHKWQDLLMSCARKLCDVRSQYTEKEALSGRHQHSHASHHPQTALVKATNSGLLVLLGHMAWPTSTASFLEPNRLGPSPWFALCSLFIRIGVCRSRELQLQRKKRKIAIITLVSVVERKPRSISQTFIYSNSLVLVIYTFTNVDSKHVSTDNLPCPPQVPL